MAIREDIVASAVTFLQDPSVAASPVESRIAFLQSKNLTPEEVDAALARAEGSQAAAPSYANYAPQQQQVARQPPPGYGGGYQQQWQPQAPPELPKRDWRDWFIMATVVGGVGYGLYTVAKRYVVPLIAPPTPPQLEQDKASIDASFEQAFSLLDQLSKDTDALKSAEEQRTTRLDAALADVESAISELKTSARRRDDESRRTADEVRSLKDLIPKAIDGQKESTDARLVELNAELKSLKKLMGQRMAPASPQPSTFGVGPSARATITPSNITPAPSAPQSNGTSSPAAPASEGGPKPASVSNGKGIESTASLPGRGSSTPYSAGVPTGRAPIPAWQMAAANKAAAAAPAASSSTPPAASASDAQEETQA
ncbi:hypothetical protein V500_04400 [Pseudogymnoascus sp. VKM F-4518 (FW-2643)]|nr:hypothetical protein V500_04400 [Pseudogymnoascus sp. VKM F-4518 (FW-2643)]